MYFYNSNFSIDSKDSKMIPLNTAMEEYKKALSTKDLANKALTIFKLI